MNATQTESCLPARATARRTLALAAVLLAGCAAIPKDDAVLTDVQFDGLMGSRSAEILLVYRNALSGKFTAGVDDTVGLNGASPTGGGDSARAALLDPLDWKWVENDNGALSTVKSGPRSWTVDKVGVKAGVVRNFQGLEAHWVTWFPIPKELRQGKDLSRAVMHAERDTTMSVNEGSRVCVLDDPDGNSWVMKSASLIEDPDQKLGTWWTWGPG